MLADRELDVELEKIERKVIEDSAEAGAAHRPRPRGTDRRSQEWSQPGSNRRPPALQGKALSQLSYGPVGSRL